nr:HAD family hydrolase [Variovorax sp. dw_954]
MDDTLYKEVDYRWSGLQEVCDWVERVYERVINRQLIRSAQNAKDPLAIICELAGLPLSIKDSLLWIYRLHVPSIRLDEEIIEVLAFFEKRCRTVAILTDGRSLSQRQKIRALKLNHLPVYISEEYGSEKPGQLRFLQIMKDFPARSYVYVGDNPKKDFVAPNALGWKTIGLRGTNRNIHSQGCEGLPEEYLPNLWVDCLTCLASKLC